VRRENPVPRTDCQLWDNRNTDRALNKEMFLYCLVYFSEITLIVSMMRVLYVEYRSVASTT